MTPPARIRPFTPADLPGCLALFDSNCPPFFDPSERADYEQFLRDPDDHGDYFVLEREGELLACGGVWLKADEPQAAGLSWGMVRRDRHGAGLGGQLPTFRLGWIRKRWPGVNTVRINTGQRTEGYFTRHGFVVTGRTPDGFAPGLDDVAMALRLG